MSILFENKVYEENDYQNVLSKFNYNWMEIDRSSGVEALLGANIFDISII